MNEYVLKIQWPNRSLKVYRFQRWANAWSTYRQAARWPETLTVSIEYERAS